MKLRPFGSFSFHKGLSSYQLKSRAVLRLGATALTLSKTRCCEGENWSSQEETGKNLRHTQGTASFLKVTRQVLGRAGK